MFFFRRHQQSIVSTLDLQFDAIETGNKSFWLRQISFEI